jgi:hypothetical protein
MYLVLFYETVSVDIVGEGWEGNAEDFNLYNRTGFMNI